MKSFPVLYGGSNKTLSLMQCQCVPVALKPLDFQAFPHLQAECRSVVPVLKLYATVLAAVKSDTPYLLSLKSMAIVERYLSAFAHHLNYGIGNLICIVFCIIYSECNTDCSFRIFFRNIYRFNNMRNLRVHGIAC